MNKLKSHFRFSKQERSGIFFLLLIILSLQVGYYFYVNFFEDTQQATFAVDYDVQVQIDTLKQAALQKGAAKIYPFNPNFITDYKGYVLGMSTDEIDRLHVFRKQNQFANTAEEFQKVTQVSDSLLDVISPHFKFPEWTKKRPGFQKGNENIMQWASNNRKYLEDSTMISEGGGQNEGSLAIVDYGQRSGKGARLTRIPPVSIHDLNSATAEELRTVNGIGEKLSARIIKFRDRLGGFLSDDQLNDVYGLDAEVVERTLERFRVRQKPNIQKINVNTASAYEIATLVYIQKRVAESIVEYRNVNNGILFLDELKNIEGFPSDKIDRIALYLSL